MRVVIILSTLAFLLPGATMAKSGPPAVAGTIAEADLSAAKKAAKKKAPAKVKKPKVEYLKAAPRY